MKLGPSGSQQSYIGLIIRNGKSGNNGGSGGGSSCDWQMARKIRENWLEDKQKATSHPPLPPPKKNFIGHLIIGEGAQERERVVGVFSTRTPLSTSTTKWDAITESGGPLSLIFVIL